MSSSCSISRLTPQESTYAHFRAYHLIPNEPCIFSPELVQQWSIYSLAFPSNHETDYDYLSSTYGHLQVDCIDCGTSSTSEEPIETFGHLLGLWKSGRGRNKYLKDWHLPLHIHQFAETPGKGKEKVREELYQVSEVCLDDWMNEFECSREGKGDDFIFVYAGGGSTFTPLHRDVYCSYSISTQLFGRKLWYLFPPSCTPLLQPLIQAANRSDDGSGVNCHEWTEERKEEFRGKGMMKVYQEKGETIFIPSGWFHSVHNLSHPTFSLNHNWCNAHNLPQIYSSLSEEVGRCREAISDVKELLREKARREGKEGEEGWKREWEEAVDGLVERSEGWSWRTFWKMTLNTLKALEISQDELEERFKDSRWPVIPPSAKPPTGFVVDQVRPLVGAFRKREEEEYRHLSGLEDVIEGIERELSRLSQTRQRSER